MDLLLTHGYFLNEDPKELQIMKPYVPLGILYLASHLRTKGFAVEVFDTTFASRQELFDVLRSTPPAVLGVYANLMTRPNVAQILRVARERGVSVEEAQAAIALLKARGIQTGMFLMWGYRGEEMSDIEATVEHVKRCEPDTVPTTAAYPIKGTPYFEEVASSVVKPKAWAESSDRDYRIRGRHSRRYYQSADQLLRSEYALAHAVSHNGDSPDAAIIAELGNKITEARQGLEATCTEVEA